MLTLQRARRNAQTAGEPLPTVWPVLADNGVHFRRSQLTLLAAAPGVGKSLLSVSLALGIKVPSLYYSADSDEHTMYTRIGAQLTGWPTVDVEQAVRERSPGYRTVEAAMQAAEHIRWSFNPDPDIGDLELDIEAMAGVYGEYPHLIVIDNLSDLYASDEEGQLSLNERCAYLKTVARNTSACVVALHHVTGQYDDGNVPVPLSGLIDKISKKPEMILTLDRDPNRTRMDGAQFMNVRPVKNRGASADPSGSTAIPLIAHMKTMRLEGESHDQY